MLPPSYHTGMITRTRRGISEARHVWIIDVEEACQTFNLIARVRFSYSPLGHDGDPLGEQPLC